MECRFSSARGSLTGKTRLCTNQGCSTRKSVTVYKIRNTQIALTRAMHTIDRLSHIRLTRPLLLAVPYTKDGTWALGPRHPNGDGAAEWLPAMDSGA